MYNDIFRILGGLTHESWEGNRLKYDEKALLFSISLLKALRVQDNMPVINASPELLPTFGVDNLHISENEAYVRIHLNSYGRKRIEI